MPPGAGARGRAGRGTRSGVVRFRVQWAIDMRGATHKGSVRERVIANNFYTHNWQITIYLCVALPLCPRIAVCIWFRGRATNQFACGNSKDLLPTFFGESREGVAFLACKNWKIAETENCIKVWGKMVSRFPVTVMEMAAAHELEESNWFRHTLAVGPRQKARIITESRSPESTEQTKEKTSKPKPNWNHQQSKSMMMMMVMAMAMVKLLPATDDVMALIAKGKQKRV